VPRGYEVVANGFLTQVSTRRGQTTYEWDASEPMASYLATIDIGSWDVHQWKTESGIPVYDAVDSALTGGLRQAIDSSLARQGEILDVLEAAFGCYPFSTVGAIVDNQDDLFFALENRTRPVYSKYFQRWAKSQAGGDRSTAEFIALAERISHQRLDALFDAWLFTPGKPAIATAGLSGPSSLSTASQGFTKQWLAGLSDRQQKGRY